MFHLAYQLEELERAFEKAPYPGRQTRSHSKFLEVLNHYKWYTAIIF